MSLVEVTQADRALFISLFHIPTRHQAGVLSSSQDATVEMQSIARHRIAEREACAMVAETQTERSNRDTESDEGIQYGVGYEQGCADAAAAIRARS